MILGKKWFYILFSSLFVILVIINLALWMTTPGIANTDIPAPGTYYHGTAYSPNKYIGFGTLFDLFSTFPGPSMTLETLNQWVNVFSNFDVTGIVVLDYFIALFRLITGPIALSVSLIGDVVSNLIWFFKLIFIDTWWSKFETHETIYNMPLN